MLLRARLLVAGRRSRSGPLLAQDLAQEALAKLLALYGEAGLRERAPASVYSLAWRTMKNLVIDESRRKRPLLHESDPDDERGEPSPPDPGPLQDEKLEKERRAARLRASLAELEPMERQFLLEVVERDSVPAAQAACGWPPSSPYYHLRRLMKVVRESLGEGVSPLSSEG